MTSTTIQARMKNPAKVLPAAMDGIGSLYKAMHSGGVTPSTLELVHLRVSQVNECSPCVEAGALSSAKAGVPPEQLWAVSAWRDSPRFTDSERAALAMAEAATRLSDGAAGVTDQIWDEAADHFDEAGLAAIILMIATTNFFNRINRSINEPAGAVWG